MRSFFRKLISRYLSLSFSWVRGFEVVLSAVIGRVHERDYEIIRYLLNPGSTIIDVGSNLGQSVTSFSVVVKTPRIISFEPNPSCAHLYNLISGINRYLRRTNSTGIKKGLSDRVAELIFYVPSFRGVDYLQEASVEISQVALEKVASRIGASVNEIILGEFRAAVSTLDQFHYKPDLIKVDVQGAELSVLRGAIDTIRRSSPYLLVEKPDDPLLKSNLVSFIELELKYSILCLSNNYLCHPGSLLPCELVLETPLKG